MSQMRLTLPPYARQDALRPGHMSTVNHLPAIVSSLAPASGVAANRVSRRCGLAVSHDVSALGLNILFITAT